MNTVKCKRLVSAVLTVLSLLTLLFGWIAVKGDTKEVFVPQMKAVVEQMDTLIDNFKDYSSYLSVLFGDGFKKGDLKSVRSVIKKFADGAISPLEAAGLAPGFSRAVVLLKNYGLGSGTSSGTFWLWLYALLFWATLICGVLGLAGHIRGSAPTFAAAYAGGVVLLVLGFLILQGRLKDAGLGGSMGLTLWPFITVLLAAGAMFGEKLAAKLPVTAGAGAAVAAKPAAKPAAPARPAAGWTCPGCGAQLADSAAFCTKCGTRRPQKAFCTNCGAELKPGAAFCTKCGAKQGAGPQPAPAPQPEAIPQTAPAQEPAPAPAAAPVQETVLMPEAGPAEE